MDTIGILGGMGPAATAHFVERLVERVAAARDQDHPSWLVYNAAHIPDRTTHLLENGPDPTAELQRCAAVLEGAGAAFLAIPCNSAHAYLAPIREAVEIPVLDMIDLAAEAAARATAAGAKVGILAATGTVELGLYQRALAARDRHALQPERDTQIGVMDAIRAIKAGASGADLRLQAAIQELLDAGASTLVLGCTELPLGVAADDVTVPLLDATEVLVATCLTRAGARLAS